MKRKPRFKYRVVIRVTKNSWGDPLPESKRYWREWSKHHSLQAAEQEAATEDPSNVKIEKI